VSYEHLWAPWRLGYIVGESENSAVATEEPRWLEGADPSCFLCRAVAENRDRENLVVARTEHAVTILNRYPYNNGHLLVAPRRHLGRLDELTDEQLAELQREIARWVAAIEKQMNAEGFNVGLNLGRAAGAGLPGHLHWHVVPRWSGDVNFMSSLAGVRVIPQSLEALWELLSGGENE
jgi:ATP adenylyltransferase